MITRYAMFQGHINDGQTLASRAAVLDEVYLDRAAVDAALASPIRAAAKAATEAVLARYFHGHIHHHITEAHDFTM